MKLYNLKNLVVVSINDKKLICQKKEGELSLVEALTGQLIYENNHLPSTSLQKKYCFAKANFFCVLDEEQIEKYYFKLNQLTEESTTKLLVLIEQALKEYYQEYEISMTVEDGNNAKNERRKNSTDRVSGTEKSLNSSVNFSKQHNPALSEKEMVRKRTK